jgi:WD40 repeat protein
VSVPSIQYQAFISYSHAADQKVAPALGSAVEGFGQRPRVLKVYCDRTDLNVSPGLWSSIQSQLGACAHLILLASPEAAQSPWVGREVETWLERRGGSAENLSIVLTGGEIIWDATQSDFDWERTTALPQTLRGRYKDEPKYLDARSLRGLSKLSLRDPVFEDVVASIAARLQGKTKRELISEELREQRRRRRQNGWLAAGFTLLALVAIVSAVLVFRTNRELDAKNVQLDAKNLELEESVAEEKKAKEQAEQRQKAAQAELTLNQQPGRLRDSIALAVESIGVKDAPESLEAYQTLERGLDLLPREVHRLALDSAPQALSLSAQGNRLLTATGSTIQIWNTKTFRRVLSWKMPLPVIDAQLSADGKRMAVAGGGAVTIFEVSGAGAPKAVGGGSARQIQRVALSASGEFAAASYLGSAFRVFRVGERQYVQEGSHPGIRTTAFAADDSAVIAGGNLGIALSPVRGGRSASCPIVDATHVAIARSGGYAATAGQTGVIEIRRLSPNAAQPCTNLQAFPHQGRLTALAVSDDGRYVGASSHDGTARVWDIARGREVARATHSGAVTHLALGTEGTFWTAGADGSVSLWEIQSNREQFRHPAAVRSVSFLPGNRLLTASQDGDRRVWRLFGSAGSEMTEEIQSIDIGDPERPNTLVSSASSPDGQAIAIVISDGTAYVSKTRPAGTVEFQITLDDVGATAMSNGGQLLAAGDASGRVEVYDANNTGSPRRKFLASGAITALAFDSQSTTLAAGTRNGFVHTWRLQGAEGSQRKAADGVIQSMVFAPDGRLAVATASDGALLLGAESLLELQRYGKDVDSPAVAVSPDNRYLAVAGSGGVLRIWELLTHRQVAQITQPASIHALAFSGDGRRIAVGREDQVAAVFRWDPSDLVREACSRLGPQFNGSSSYRGVCRR